MSAKPAREAARKPDPSRDIATLAKAVRAGDRRALARAITLVESSRADHRADAQTLLDALLPHTGNSIRLGITGIPGVGKSTFIEEFGLRGIEAGHRIAVLAVDPTSQRSGGSILGDKTRMVALTRHADAFIRPSPAGRTLGGVARRSREAIRACESAGFDRILVETVGVGQSETAVHEMVDMFLLLLAPGGGDELQGIKKGIVELADLLIVNKADGDLASAAGRAAGEYHHAMQLLHPPGGAWVPPVVTCSALEGKGIGDIWDKVADFDRAMADRGGIRARRAAQARSWMWSEIGEELMAALRADPRVRGRVGTLEDDVTAGRATPSAAARELLALFLDRPPPSAG